MVRPDRRASARKSFVLVLLGTAIFFLCSVSSADVPHMISYQGKLTTAEGGCLNDTVQMTFAIYPDTLGSPADWFETQTEVVVKEGVFNVLLGAVDTIPSAVFDGNTKYLGVRIESDPEMRPLKPIVSVAYAYRAGVADAGGVGSGWIDDGAVVRLETGADSVVIGTYNPWGKLAVGGDIAIPWYGDYYYKVGPYTGLGWNSTTGSIRIGSNMKPLEMYAGSVTPRIVVNTSGSVGIGTTSPVGKIHVETSDLYSGYFTSGALSHSTHVIHSEFTGTGIYDAKAVYGKCIPADYLGFGGLFEGGGIGVSGRVSPTGSHTYAGAYGTTSGGSGLNCGVYGWAAGSGENHGVHGSGSGPGTVYAIYGDAGNDTADFAGYFRGNVSVTGTLTKGGGGFKIDHPLHPQSKYLNHSFVESPDMKNVYDGVVVLDTRGEAVVELPDYFEALNRDFRYQLTCIGGFAPVYIAEKITDNSFKIAGGEASMEVSWMVTGIRKDAFADANRIQVEVYKPAKQRGKYLHPEAYRLGEEYGIHYEQHKRMKELQEKVN